LCTFAATVGLWVPRALYAQFTDPRTYANSPVGISQLELDYAYLKADASVDTSLVVVDSKLKLNVGTVAYTRDFSLLHHLAWAKASVPLAYLSGSVAGTNIAGSVAGPGDASLELATLLKGGRALGVAEFSNYQPTTTWGVSLLVTAPTGRYDADRLLNLGSDRWSFRPEMALSHPFGRDRRWEVDGYFNVAFYSDNTAYRGREILRQDPLAGVETHISYGFGSNLWASLDARYAFRGDTFVDRVDQQDPQDGVVLGSEAGWSPSSRSSIVLVFAKAVVHKNAPDYTGVVIKLAYSWGQGRNN
jgi:hypothetical protein